MDLGLHGKTAIITGGSRGIGRSIAETLLREGVNVAFCARDNTAVDSTVDELSRIGRVTGTALDVSDADALAQWVRSAGENFGGIDIVVGNATGKGGSRSMEEDPLWSHVSVDLLSFVRAVDYAMPYLEESEGASVISIASTVAVEHFGAGACAFNTIKAGLINYTAGLSQTLAPKGIRANVVSPGPIFIEGGAWDTIKERKPEFYSATMDNIPLGRFGTGDDVGRAVAFLASSAASFITGENLVVDGGLTRRVAY